MKVILLEELKGQGGEGDVVEVKRGYAVNYLFPRKLAIEASKGNLKQLELRKHNIAKRETDRLDSADKIQAALANRVLTIPARVGEEGQLFGSVTSQQIADKLNAELGLSIDRKKIDQHAPIKTAGEHTVTVSIYRDVKATLNVNVVDESTLAVEEVAEAAEAAEAVAEEVAEEVVEAEEIAEEVVEAEEIAEAVAEVAAEVEVEAEVEAEAVAEVEAEVEAEAVAEVEADLDAAIAEVEVEAAIEAVEAAEEAVLDIDVEAIEESATAAIDAAVIAEEVAEAEAIIEAFEAAAEVAQPSTSEDAE